MNEHKKLKDVGGVSEQDDNPRNTEAGSINDDFSWIDPQRQSGQAIDSRQKEVRSIACKKRKCTTETLDSKKYLQTRCSILKFVNTVKSFDGSKMMAVKSLGFGGIMRLQVTKLDRKLIEFLARNFDCSTSCLNVHGRKLMLSPVEVEWMMGLSSNGVEVGNFLRKDTDVQKEFNLAKSSIKVSKLIEDLKDLPPNDEFKAKFLLYVVSTVIRPNTSFYSVNPRLLGLLKELSSCKNLNWAKYTLEGLVEGIRQYQYKQDSVHCTWHITGCIMLLELFYLEHLDVGSWKVPRHMRNVPRVMDWNDNNVSSTLGYLFKIGGYEDLDMMKGEDTRFKNFMCKLESLPDELTTLKAELKSKLTTFSNELTADMNKFKDELKAEFKSELTTFNNELTAKINKFKEELKVELKVEMGAILGDVSSNAAKASIVSQKKVSEPGGNPNILHSPLVVDNLGFDERDPIRPEHNKKMARSSNEDSPSIQVSPFFKSDSVGNVIGNGVNMSPSYKIVENQKVKGVGVKSMRERGMKGKQTPVQTKVISRRKGRRIVSHSSSSGIIMIQSEKKPRNSKRTNLRSSNKLRKGKAVSSPFVDPQCKGTKKVKQTTVIDQESSESASNIKLEYQLLDAVMEISRYVYYGASMDGDDEMICDFGNQYATRRDFLSMQPMESIKSTILDVVANALTLDEIAQSDERKNWYLPTHFAVCVTFMS